METPNYHNLLQSVGKIIKDREEQLRKSGDSFNIFSILGLERAENRTHSAFIRGLLNPTGTHGQGNRFLKLFLETIGHAKFDLDNAFVHPGEKDFGRISEDFNYGGRIEIYLRDRKGNVIAIENKIDARDQYRQLLRYYNHIQQDGAVYYLTLTGNDASTESKENLIKGKHYHLISYRKHILEWLDKCIQVAGLAPNIISSIRQYFLLIRKLTNTMDKAHTDELYDAILEHYEAAKAIGENFLEAKASLLSEIREKVFKLLESRLKDEFYLWLGNDVKREYAQIWLKLIEFNEKDIFLGLESFSALGKFNETLYVGWYNKETFPVSHPKLMTAEEEYEYWIRLKELPDFESFAPNFINNEFVLKLKRDIGFRERFIEFVAKETEMYMKEQIEPLRNYFNHG
jgi:hypothetical protein